MFFIPTAVHRRFQHFYIYFVEYAFETAINRLDFCKDLIQFCYPIKVKIMKLERSTQLISNRFREKFKHNIEKKYIFNFILLAL